MNYRRTKIVATFGPSTISKSMIEKMIVAGVNVARVNMSHYSKDFDIHNLVKNIKATSKRLGKSVSIIMDLPGPKIRTSNEKNIDIIQFLDSEEFVSLNPLIRDLILLENPIKKLCSKECKGLCANCGTNFNKLDCECEISIEDNRWIELKKLNN